MNPDETIFCVLEGDPAVTFHDKSGGMTSFIYRDKAWRKDDTLDVFLNAGVVKRDAFDRMFPGVGLPDMRLIE